MIGNTGNTGNGGNPGAIRLEVERGPLGPHGLARIAATYGTVDSRYASVDFCERVFDRNPYGGSLHGFLVREGGPAETVGHYAVVPVRAIARGAPVRSGKGEALYVAPAVRAALLEGAPAAVTLMRTLHDAALSAGAQVLHNRTTPDIGMLQRMDGFTRISLRRRLAHVVFDPAPFPKIAASRALRSAAAAAGAFQRAAGMVGGWSGRAAGARAARVTDAAGALAILEDAARKARPVAGWSVARDAASLAWHLEIGHLQVHGAERTGDYALITTGRSREIVGWNAHSSAAGLALLDSILRTARREGAALVSIDPDGPGILGGNAPPLRAFGFLRFGFPAELYVKSPDGFFRDPSHLEFDRLFHL